MPDKVKIEELEKGREILSLLRSLPKTLLDKISVGINEDDSFSIGYDLGDGSFSYSPHDPEALAITQRLNELIHAEPELITAIRGYL